MNLPERFTQKYGRLPTERDPDYLEMLRMSKYRILDRPDVNMAKCANCGATKDDGRKYVDFGLDVPWYGVVFICGTCVEEIARKMDVFKPMINRLRVLEEENKNLDHLEEQGTVIKEAISNLIEEVKDYFDKLDLYTTGNESSPDIRIVVGDNQGSTESGSDSDESIVNAESDATSESPTESGRQDFSSLTELLKSKPSKR